MKNKEELIKIMRNAHKEAYCNADASPDEAWEAVYQALKASISPVSANNAQTEELAREHAENILKYADEILLGGWPVKPLEKPTDTQDNDGWIKHDGGKCPVSEGDIVDVKF